MKDFFELRENKIFFVKVGDGRDSMTVKVKANTKGEAIKKLKAKYPKYPVSLDQNQKQGKPAGALESVELDEAVDLMKMSKELLKHKSKGVNYEKAAAYVRAIHNNSNVNVQDKAMKGLLDLLKNMDLTDRTTITKILKDNGFKVKGGRLMRESVDLTENYRTLARAGMGTESKGEARVGLELDYYDGDGSKRMGKITKVTPKGYIVKDEKDGKSRQFTFHDRAKAKEILARLGKGKYNESVELEEKRQVVTPDQLEKILVKHGNNPKDAKAMVKKHASYVMKKYSTATASKMAEVISSLDESVKTEDKGQFIYAAKQAKAKGDSTFVFAGKTYNCEEVLENENLDENLDESKTVKVSRADFDKLKKGSIFDVAWDGAMSAGAAALKVVSKSRSAKYDVEKIKLMPTNGGGSVPFYLYSRKGGDATLAIGNMGASMTKYKIVKESVELEEAVAKVKTTMPDKVASGAQRFGLKATAKGGHVSISGSKGKLNDFMRAIIGRSSYGNASDVTESVELTEKNTIDIAREIVKTKGAKHGLDMQSANLILKVYDMVNDKNKKKMETMSPSALGQAIWKIYAKMKGN